MTENDQNDIELGQQIEEIEITDGHLTEEQLLDQSEDIPLGEPVGVSGTPR